MPVYEYACKACAQHIEVAQSFRDDPLTTCPNCGGPLRKVFGSIGISFKGSGFYRTDSRTPAKTEKKAEAGEKSDEKSDKGEKVSTSSDGSATTSSGEKGGSSGDKPKADAKSA